MMKQNNFTSTEECMEELRNRIFETLHKKNCTMTEIAEECGVSVDAVSNILCGKRTGIRLMTFLNISYGIGLLASAVIADAEKKKGGAV